MSVVLWYDCVCCIWVWFFFFQAEDGIRDLVRSRGLGDVYKRQALVILGLVLIFRRRAGYWSAEALIGTELLLLGLAGATFVRGENAVNWNARLDGTGGGLIGWALGNLGMDLLGPSLATLLLSLIHI